MIAVFWKYQMLQLFHQKVWTTRLSRLILAEIVEFNYREFFQVYKIRKDPLQTSMK